MSRLVWLVLTFAVAAFPQATSTFGELRGNVVDASGAGVAGAKVTAVSTASGLTRATAADGAGHYVLPLLPPGSYDVKVEAAGFSGKRFEGVEIRVGDIRGMDVELAVGQVSAEIEVRDEPPPVETERTQQANTVEQVRINNLPINRRNYLDFALLTPGVVETTTLVDDANFRPIQTPNSGLSFGGSNGRGNGFYIDGLENYGGSSGVRPSVSQEAALEFQINRNSFTAEFGNAQGGIINIITKSGTNDLHGNVFGFIRQRNIQARNYFDPAKSAFTRVQAGATLGGAIKKDRSFFFTAYERLNRRETSFVPIASDRSLFTRLTPSQEQLVGFFEATGNPLLRGLAVQARQLLTPANNPAVPRLFAQNTGNFPFAEDTDSFSLRLDHRFTDNHSIFLRSNTAWAFQQNSSFGALDGYNRGRSLDSADTTVALGDLYVASSSFFIETRAMFAYAQLDVIPTNRIGPEININGYGFFGRQIFLPYDGIERHYQFLQNYTKLQGKHTLKFGFDVNPMRNSIESETFFGGRFTFGTRIPLASVLISATGDPSFPNTVAALLTASGQQRLIPNLTQPITALQSFALGIPELYQQGFGIPNYVNMIYRNHFYVQDTWKVSPHLSLNFGLRYELEKHNPIIPKDRNNIGPRFGFAWSPGKSMKTAIRGGYGLYYGQITSNVAGTSDPLSGRFINQILLTPSSTLFRDARGQFVTSATVYQTLQGRGILNARSIQESDLSQLFNIRVGPNLPGSVVFAVSPDMVNPYAHQASFEIERQVGSFAVSAAYNFNRGAHLARIRGTNVRYGAQRLPDGRPTFERINPLVLQHNVFESNSNSFYHAGILQVTRRFSKGFMLNAHYTLSRAIDEFTDFNSDYSPADQLNARGDRGLSSFHQKHRVVVNAVYESPWRAGRGKSAKENVFGSWTLAPIFNYNSRRPFNVMSGVDVQGDTYVNNKRPAHLGRNMGQGPNFATFDARLARKFAYGEGSRYVEFIAEGFNLLNRTNFRSLNNVVGDVPISALPNPIVGNRGLPSTPLAFTGAFNPRQFQFGLKIYW
ncbi:MAG: hypothetical protein FJW40_00065 [Acidobacteria bacterium]|nr:hypothetical protein [Acidobacteriota bacterium]